MKTIRISNPLSERIAAFIITSFVLGIIILWTLDYQNFINYISSWDYYIRTIFLISIFIIFYIILLPVIFLFYYYLLKGKI